MFIDTYLFQDDILFLLLVSQLKEQKSWEDVQKKLFDIANRYYF